MKFDEMVAVSGLPGVYKMIANRSNGLIVKDIETSKTRFASSRKHQFTPLASIGIFTDDDTTELKEVFKIMKDKLTSNPLPKPNAPDELKKYFAEVLPNYDRDKVHVNDIKKVVKWFTFLDAKDLLDFSDEEKEAEVKDDKKDDKKVVAKADDKKEAKKEEKAEKKDDKKGAKAKVKDDK